MAKTVFISGATSGIGLVTAQKLHELGWKVYAGGLQSDDFSVLEYGITPLPFDISDATDIEGAVKFMTIDLNQLDALVNCAGIQVSSPLEALPVERLRQQFEVNVFGHFQIIQGLLPLLRQSEKGRIVNVSSLMGQVAMPMLGAYSMSKHALEAMSDVLRMELAQFGIHVAVVEPSAIDTPMTSKALHDLEALRQASSDDIQIQYEHFFDAMTKTLASQGQHATPPAKIANAIIHAITSNRPKARYAIGIDVMGLSTIRKILPESLFDRILLRALGIK
ncbi:MAG: oxidoreductase [Phototrophicaceae bacterium]